MLFDRDPERRVGCSYIGITDGQRFEARSRESLSADQQQTADEKTIEKIHWLKHDAIPDDKRISLAGYHCGDFMSMKSNPGRPSDGGI
jgi:hypothetical protein